jgi:hypothetical protein
MIVRMFVAPGIAAVLRMAVLCVAAVLCGCSRAEPELTPAALQAFMDARIKSHAARDAKALCDQYADSAKVTGGPHGSVDSEVLTKQPYCQQLAESFVDQDQAPLETRLSLKSMAIAANARSAELGLEQVDVFPAQGSQPRYEIRLQINDHIEAIAGKPLITREARKGTLLDLPQSSPQDAQQTPDAVSPPGSSSESRTESGQVADRNYTQESMASRRREECERQRADLAALERIRREGLPRGEIRTPEEMAELPKSIQSATAAVAHFCQ